MRRSAAAVLSLAWLAGCGDDDAARVPCGGATLTTRDIAYAATDPANRLDLYQPAEGRDCPLIVWIHGGGWQSGSKDLGPGARDRLLPLVAAGYAVASVEYRLSGVATFPAQIDDVKAAVRHLRANAASYRLDPDRFAAWGTSAGGHLAALLGVSAETSDGVQAVIDCYGPIDLPQMDSQLGDIGCGARGHSLPGSPESKLLGCAEGLTVDCPQAFAASPLAYIDAADPPFPVGHGRADCTVPWPQSQALHDALRAAGVRSSLTLVDGGEHEIGSCPDDAAVRAFLGDVL